MTWSDWPAPRNAARSVVAAASILATVLAIAMFDPWLAAVGCVVLVVATGEVLLPTRFTLSAEGVAVQRPFSRRAQPWSRFDGFRRTDGGLVLLGSGSRPLLRRHRTVVLRGPGHLDAALPIVTVHLQERP